MASRWVVISGGDYSSALATREGDRVVACDKGLEHAARMGVRPELIIGDFDSYTKALPEGIPALKLPREKDDTDTLFAVRYAADHGCRELVLTCALGGRFDHSYANIQSCAYAAERGIDVSIVEDATDIYFLCGGSIELRKAEGRSLSVFSLSERCTGVCESGVKYPLEEQELTRSFPLGVSNEWAAPTARISVRDGTLMIVVSKK